MDTAAASVASEPKKMSPAHRKPATKMLQNPAETATLDAATLLFDPDWYREQYPDVAQAGIDPVRHYFDDGAREGRDPNPVFSTRGYLARYQDVAESRMNPFLHFLLYGAREGRNPSAA